MKLIKLNAIDSTNDFLKGLSSNQLLENFTVVTAESQSKGKGQMGAEWVSETGKNLTVSVLIKEILKDNNQIFDLNVAVALAICDALIFFEIPKISIKWPNDIMSGNKKIAGILIENIFKSNGEISSIVGFGLNVNQTNFENLPSASSLKNVTLKDFDKDLILSKIIENMKYRVFILQNDNSNELWENYNNCLFKKGIIMPFCDIKGDKFMGIIQSVSRNGKLQLLLENDKISEFEIKEIQMIY